MIIPLNHQSLAVLAASRGVCQLGNPQPRRRVVGAHYPQIADLARLDLGVVQGEELGATMADIVDETVFVTDVSAVMAILEPLWCDSNLHLVSAARWDMAAGSTLICLSVASATLGNERLVCRTSRTGQRSVQPQARRSRRQPRQHPSHAERLVVARASATLVTL